MDRAQIAINALAKIQEGNYGSEDVKCIAHDALDAIERATKCQACKGTGMIRNDQSNQGWDDCPHCVSLEPLNRRESSRRSKTWMPRS